ncbi:hypothetical protein ZWY2020_014884 [Hordeum vulgare]|nr:hypothetical protein ZWY2020_014884 [Hordeum vulgare]
MPPRRAPTSNFLRELTQLIHQQNTLMQLIIQNQNNNNRPPPQADNLTRFLRLNPPTFSSSIEPIVADDWIRKMERELIPPVVLKLRRCILPRINLKALQLLGGRTTPPLIPLLESLGSNSSKPSRPHVSLVQ